MGLKAGTVDDFTDSMAAAIETAMETQWKAAKQFDLLPPDGQVDVDRQILFCAIAQGVLGYLKNHPNDVLTSITLQLPDGQQVAFPVTALGLNVGS